MQVVQTVQIDLKSFASLHRVQIWHLSSKTPRTTFTSCKKSMLLHFIKNTVNYFVTFLLGFSIYTGQQKKGYKVICLLFYKTERHIFLHIVNIMYVVLEWICQIWTKWSEAKLRHVSLNGFAGLSTISQLFLYNGSQIVVVVERECSKPAENQQTLITNRLQETLVPTQNTQNNEKIKIFWKASLLTLTNDFFCYLTPSLHHPASLYEKGVSARKRF